MLRGLLAHRALTLTCLVVAGLLVSGVAFGGDPAGGDVAGAAPPSVNAADLEQAIANPTRPIFLGLIAAFFLVFGAVVGANDRPEGDPPKGAFAGTNPAPGSVPPPASTGPGSAPPASAPPSAES